jgi:hypothetical protein
LSHEVLQYALTTPNTLTILIILPVGAPGGLQIPSSATAAKELNAAGMAGGAKRPRNFAWMQSVIPWRYRLVPISAANGGGIIG